jgi:hypothetical protein
MRLICIHQDTVGALQRLHTPFDDLTPDGLWNSPYHLVGVSTEQRDVLVAFNVDFEDITPDALDRGVAAGAESLSYSSNAKVRNGQRLRTSVRGKYLEATVQGGKILVDGRTYDSPGAATRGISSDKTEWAFWEYLDDSSGQWQVLGREWQI